MEIALVAVVALSVVVGLSLGLLGGGGSILMVPLLTYVGGLEAREAIATSLVVVGATSAVSLVGHARRGNVRWRAGLAFGAAGVVGAFLGGLAGGRLPGTVLMIAFALMMLATSIAMIRGRRGGAGGSGTDGAGCTDGSGAAADHGPGWRIPAYGLAVGSVTGLVGAGGGFLVVPALTLLAGLPMAAAVGTSLLVITMNSAAGLSGHLTSMSPDWPLVAAVTLAAVLGSLAGVRLSAHVPEAALRRTFGYVVLVMGTLVLAGELPAPAGIALVGAAAVVGLGAVACRLAADRCPLRRVRVVGAV